MTKKIWTFEEVREKIEEEMDLQEESFVSQTEFLDYCNEGIDEAEAEIMGTYQEYFLTKAAISLVAGTSEYALPADIYANKIRHIQFKQGQNVIYKVKKIDIDDVMKLDTSNTNQDFVYYITNDLTTGVRFVLLPTPASNDSTSMTMYYIRNAARVEDDADTIDIPEFISFIFAYMKVKIARKETSPLLDSYMAELDRQRSLMRETLDDMIPDARETIQPDMSFFDDFDVNIFD